MQRHYLIYLANLLALKRRLTELFCFDALTQVKSQAKFQSVSEREEEREILWVRLADSLGWILSWAT